MDSSSNRNEIGEGSQSNISDTFTSIVYPNRETIEIPSAFMADWKDTICAQLDACLKDHADNFFHFDTVVTRRTNCIHNGLIVAKHCGFKAPQRVVFNYLPAFNQFNMTFVDATGAEIPYLGLRYSIDYHALRLADPTKFFMPKYFWAMPPLPGHEDPWVPDQYVVISFTHPSLDGESGSGGRAGTEGSAAGDDDPDQGAGVGEALLTWEKTVSKAFPDGQSVLHFPSFVCNACPNLNGRGLIVINETTNDTVACTIKRADRPNPEFHIGGDWYRFVRMMGLKKDDKLVFAMDNPPRLLKVKVVKRGAAV